MQDLLIKNGKVLIYQDEDMIIEEKDILVQNGKIAKIEKDIEPYENIMMPEKNSTPKLKEMSIQIQTNIKDEIKIIDATNHIIMPGLINTHAHIPMSIFRETTEGCKLYEWLQDKIWPIEAKLNEEDIYWASMLSYVEMIATGTTCVNDHYFMTESIRKAAKDAGVRTVLTRVLMDTDGKDAGKQRINEFQELYETREKDNDLITYTVSPHSLYTCSDDCLQEAVKLAKLYELPVHVHFLESIDEIQDIQKQHGKPAIEVLKQYFEGIHTILAHGVKLMNKEVETLKAMDCGIAHNPVSNLRLGCKIADTTKYLQNGINVAIGTDGQGSGSNLDMFEAMRIACLIQGGIHENEERINAKDGIKMATINGAKLLGLDDKIGSIEIEKDADIILVNIEEKLDNITMLPNLNLIANLVYNTTGKNVDTTIVKGNILMENRKIKHIDVGKVIEKCKEIVNRLY